VEKRAEGAGFKAARMHIGHGIGEQERRQSERAYVCVLKRELSEHQLSTLEQLERFGWILQFVRHDDGQPPVATVLDPEDSCQAVLEADGSINKDPPMQFRAD
jgi:hypothetical protein